MSELTVVAESERTSIEVSASGQPGGRLVSFLRRHRIPLLAATLAASGAIGWVTNGALDRGETTRNAGAPSGRGMQPPRAAGTPARPPAMPAPVGARPAVSARVASDTAAAALFAPHSWHVEPPPPPPMPPPPPPPPTAPPFPYAFLGAYTQGGETVYFLSREDRVIDAHVGDHLDASYVFESADASQLVFNYVPLNIRQAVALAAVKP